MNILDAGIKSSIESRSFLKTKTGDMTETIVVRMAHSDDYPNILALQKANQIGNLTEAERKNGFLSAEIPEERIGALASDTGIVVAYDQAEFAGFFCTSRLASWRGNAIIDALVASFEQSEEYASHRISETMCLFGPMCLNQVARGKGILEKMIGLAIESAKTQFENAISFIAVDNARIRQCGGEARLSARAPLHVRRARISCADCRFRLKAALAAFDAFDAFDGGVHASRASPARARRCAA